ncbi:MAG: hypothetical protein RL325_253 [Planctomycetota bacterium]
MRSMKWTFICSATAAAVFAGAATAQDCATAPAAVVGANAFDTTASTVSLAMPAGAGCAAAHTIYKATFFTFTAEATGSYQFSLCGGSTWDTRIGILNTCDPAGGVLGCNDDSCGLQSFATAALTAGSTYKIVIGGFGAANGGTGSLTITAPGGGGGGGGGGCSNPTVLNIGDNAFTTTPTGTIVDMTGFCQMQFTQQIYNTNFFSFTPTETGSYRFSTCNTASFDTKIAVMNTCDPAGGVIACNDDGAGCTGFTSLIGNAALTAGQTYIVALGGYAATTATGTGTLSVTLNGGGGGAGCKSAAAAIEGDNPFSTAGQTEVLDLTGFCDPGPFGDDAIYNTIYFRFTPTVTAAYTVSTCNLAPFDTRLAVMNTCSPVNGVLACNDDGPDSCANFSSRIDAVELEAGVEYFIAVGGYSATDAGAGTLSITQFVPCQLPASTGTEAELCGEDLNGGCNNAAGGSPSQPIAVGDTVAGTFWAAAGTRDTDWYLLTLTEGTTVTLTINSSLDCFAAFVDTGCGAIIGAATTGTCPGTTSQCLAAGTYYVVCLPGVFDGYPCGGAVGNDYTIQVSGVACDAQPPANDNCDTAAVAVEGANPFDNTFASTEISTATCGFGGTPFTKDVWFSFTATQTGDYNLETCTGPAPFDTGIEVYSLCPSAGGTLLACNDDGAGCAAFASSLNAPMVTGTTYFIRVGGWGGAFGATTLNITFVGDAPSCGDANLGSCCQAQTAPFCNDAACCTQICAADAFCCDQQWDQVCANAAIAGCTNCQVAPPPNDACTGAVNLPVGATPFSTVGATGTTLACLKFGNTNVYNDIWYRHQATGNQTLTISLCGSTFDTKVAVFEGSCTGALIACNDDAVAPAACAGTLQSEVRFTATCGTTYYVSVGSFSATAFGSGTITVSQAGSCGPACPADLNNDGQVSSADITILLSGWGTASPDLNGDGIVGSADITVLLSAWGACP